MGDTIKISRELKIYGRIVKPDNIRELAKRVYEEYVSDKSNHKDINFILRGIDETQYESEDIKIFSNNGILDTRRIIAVEITYSNHTNDKRISIKLKHTITDYEWGNVIFVSGSDKLWVDGVIKYFEDTIANWEKQPNWPHKYGSLLAVIFAVGIGIGIGLLCLNILNFIFAYVIVVHPISPKPGWIIVLQVLFISLGLSSGIWPACYIANKLKRLYPIVELRTGPKHMQLETKRKKLVAAVISRGILPLVISLIVELIKIIIIR